MDIAIKKELIDILEKFIESRYEKAGNITRTYGNWSGNREIVEKTSFEDFYNYLKNK